MKKTHNYIENISDRAYEEREKQESTQNRR